QAAFAGPEQVAHPVEHDAPAGRQDEFDRLSVGQNADHLGDAMAADVLVLGHFLGREGVGMVPLLEGDALLLQFVSDPRCSSHGNPPRYVSVSDLDTPFTTTTQSEAAIGATSRARPECRTVRGAYASLQPDPCLPAAVAACCRPFNGRWK